MDNRDNHPINIERMIRERGKIPGTIIEIDPFTVQPNHHCALVINKVLWYALRIVVYKPPCGRFEEELIVEKISQHFNRGAVEEKSRRIKANFNGNIFNLTSKKLLLFPQISLLDRRRILEEPDEYIKPFDVVGRFSLALGYEMFYHVGIYLGNKKVCHIYFHDDSNDDNISSISSSASSSSTDKPWVRIDDWERFAENNGGLAFIFFRSVILSKDPNLIINHLKNALRAEYGRGEYSLLTKNCEHFANLIIHGINRSEQVEKAKILLGDAGFCLASSLTSPIAVPTLVTIRIIRNIFEESKNLVLKNNDDRLFDNLEARRELTNEENQIFQQLEQQYQASQEVPTNQ